MDHIKAISIKFLIMSTIIFSILGIFNAATFTEILIISMLVTGVAYLIGDLYILSRFGNLLATIADFGLSFVSLWLLGTIFFQPEFGLLPAALFTSVFISCGEAIFHIYMNRRVLSKEEEFYTKNRDVTRNLQTEFGEENHDPDIIQLNKKRYEKRKGKKHYD